MTNPTPQVMLPFIAELIGWTHLATNGKDQLLGRSPEGYAKWGVNASLTTVPDWPGSLDAARGLEVGNPHDFWVALYKTMIPEELRKKKLSLYDYATQIIWYTPTQWCLAWILYKGYRWDDTTLEFKPI